MKEDVAIRLKQAETAGLGFELPPKIADVVRIVRKNELQVAVKNAAFWEWSGRKDLNLRPPGPEPESRKF